MTDTHSNKPADALPENSFDITIVGGGMVGATLALLLEHCLPGLRIALVEARAIESEGVSEVSASEAESHSPFDARSTAISPSTHDVFRRLHLWDTLAPHATAITHIHVSDKNSPGQSRLSPDDNHGEPLGYVVGNRGMGEVLNKALLRSGVQIFAPARVGKVQLKRECAQLLLDNDQLLNTRLLVVADGADSPLRAQLGITETCFDYEQYAVVANVACSRPHGGCAYERFTRNGPLALLPWSHNQGRSAALIWTWPAEQVQAAQALSDPAFLETLQQVFGYRLGQFTGVSQRHYYPLSLRLANEAVRSRVVLMGNAAHFLHPVAGQGFNLAVRDALRLAEVLKAEVERSEATDEPRDLGRLDVLQNYQQAQHPDQSGTVLLSHSFNQLFRKTGTVAAGARSAGFLALALAAPAKDALITRLSGRSGLQARPWPQAGQP